MQRLLITGGAGFIGANFVHRWSRVVAAPLTYAGNLADLEAFRSISKFHFVLGAVCDGDLIKRLFDVVVHFLRQ